MSVPKKTSVKKSAKSKAITEIKPVTNNPIKDYVKNSVKNTLSKFLNFLKGINPFYIIGGCVVIMAIVYFLFLSPSSSVKDENKRLKDEVAQIQLERNKIKDSLVILKSDYKSLVDSGLIKIGIINQINDRLISIERDIAVSYNQLNTIKSGLNDVNQRIKNNTQNPTKRVGDDLIKSLEKKLN